MLFFKCLVINPDVSFSLANHGFSVGAIFVFV
jgi:hypothetical protein